MGERDFDGLGLTLTLGSAGGGGGGGGSGGGARRESCSNVANGFKLSLMPSQFLQSYNNHQKSSWSDLFLSADTNSDMRSVARGLDINRAPTAIECEEDVGVSSPNSTVSSISGKRSIERELMVDDINNEAERASCSQGSDDEDGSNGGDASRKKLRLSKEQSLLLEETFKEHNTLNPKQKQALAKQLNLRPRQVEVWFQNRRARTKLKQTEVDCEYLKKCCDTLSEENRRLQKEVQELRALKLSPQLYMHMTPPTTLTMCPSCERVAVSSTSSSSSAAASSSTPALTQRPQRPVPVIPWAAIPTNGCPR